MCLMLGQLLQVRLDCDFTMKVVSYNARGLRLGQGAGDKVRRIVFDELFESADILCIQETWLPKQDLDKLNSVCNDFYGAGEFTTDLRM